MTEGSADHIARERAQAALAELGTLREVLKEREHNDERRWRERDSLDEAWRKSVQGLIGEMTKAHQIAVVDMRDHFDRKLELVQADVLNRTSKSEFDKHRGDTDEHFGVIDTRSWNVAKAVIGLFIAITLSLVGVIFTMLTVRL